MERKFLLTLVCGTFLVCSCDKHMGSESGDGLGTDTIDTVVDSMHVDDQVQRKNDLVIYTPHYSRVDLVCGTMPSKKDSSVVFCAEAAFTAEILDTFKHTNINGDHVSGGVKYKGAPCRRNTGAFICYGNAFKFFYMENGEALSIAEKNKGMGFCQEMMIHNGKRVKTTRPDGNANEFRALCELNGKLCIIDSDGVSRFGIFIANLLQVGVTEALYLDMGPGWNYSWWRSTDGKVHEIHKDRISCTTNWITFYN